MARRTNEFVVLDNEGDRFSVWRGGFASTRAALREVKDDDNAPLHGVVINVCAGYTKALKQVSQATITLTENRGQWPESDERDAA